MHLRKYIVDYVVIWSFSWLENSFSWPALNRDGSGQHRKSGKPEFWTVSVRNEWEENVRITILMF
jgi:hypothetical protein